MHGSRQVRRPRSEHRALRYVCMGLACYGAPAPYSQRSANFMPTASLYRVVVWVEGGTGTPAHAQPAVSTMTQHAVFYTPNRSEVLGPCVLPIFHLKPPFLSDFMCTALQCESHKQRNRQGTHRVPNHQSFYGMVRTAYSAWLLPPHQPRDIHNISAWSLRRRDESLDPLDVVLVR
jgi:hypothetical protein